MCPVNAKQCGKSKWQDQRQTQMTDNIIHDGSIYVFKLKANTSAHLQQQYTFTFRRSPKSSSYRVKQNTNCTFLDANMRPNCQMTGCIKYSED
eukprot:scaffold37708_cov175-Skeletonema_marinoi.AAC.4